MLAGAALAGCAAVPTGEPRLDAALKTFAAPPPERAGVYVVRSSDAAPAVLVDVDVDGVPLGRLGPRSYLYREVAPGRHSAAAHAGNTATLAFDAEAGALVFVHQEMTWGFWQAGVRLRLAGEDEGRKAVLGSRLAAVVAPRQTIDVQVQAHDPAWRVPLACEASNPFGRWPFTAPGSVGVDVARAPLRIVCQPPAGAAPSPAVEVTVAATTAAHEQRRAAASGAAVGAGLGLAAGVASAPVAGPALAALLAAGGAWRGAEIGGLAAASATAPVAYPSPVVVTVPKPAP